MLKSKNDFTLDCINYILENEYSDFIEHVLNGENHKNHIYYSAIRVFYGRKGTANILKSIRREKRQHE